MGNIIRRPTHRSRSVNGHNIETYHILNGIERRLMYMQNSLEYLVHRSETDSQVESILRNNTFASSFVARGNSFPHGKYSRH
jgi:hypothetical protein